MRKFLTITIWSILGVLFLAFEFAPLYMFVHPSIYQKYYWIGLILASIFVVLAFLEFNSIFDISNRFLQAILGGDAIVTLLFYFLLANEQFPADHIFIGGVSFIFFVSFLFAGLALLFGSEYQDLKIRHGIAIISFSYIFYAIMFILIMVMNS